METAQQTNVNHREHNSGWDKRHTEIEKKGKTCHTRVSKLVPIFKIQKKEMIYITIY